MTSRCYYRRVNVRALRLFLLAMLALAVGAASPSSGFPSVRAAIPEHATVYRDEYGVPHIYGDSAAAASFAFGYVQAQDHLSQMRRNYLTAAGRLAETGLGNSSADGFVHLLDLPETGQAALSAMPAGDRERIEAFAGGVNKYITEHPGQPAWMLPVEPYEILAWVQYISLLPEYQIALSKLPAGAALPAARESAYGSNMWAIAPSKSALGVPILQGDPHLGWQGATQWYEAHLNYPGVNVAGSTFLGWPLIAMGATDNVAWTMTDNSPNNADLYRETLNPANNLQYLRDGDWVDLEQVTSTIQRLGQSPVQVTNYYSVHGPIVNKNATYAYAAAMPSFDLNDMVSKTIHVFESPDAASFFNPTETPRMAKWNVIVADRLGHIMYVDNMRMPHKSTSVNWNQAVDGSLSANDWGPFLTYAELPMKVDPSNGYLQNANNSPWTTAPDLNPASYPPYVSPGNWMGERGRRAVEWLESQPAFTFQDMEDMSMDDVSWSGRGLAALIGPAWADNPRPDPDGSIAAGVSLLSAWDGRQEKTSAAVALGREWVIDFFALGPTFGRENVPAYGSMAAADKTKLIDALVTAIGNARANFGIMNPVWGDVHKIPRGALYPVGGGSGQTPALRMANTTTLSGGVYQAYDGSSYQFVVAMTSPPTFYSIRPYGESEDPASPHYADQTALYGNNQFKLMPFTLADVIAHSGPPQVLDYYPAVTPVGGLAVQAEPAATPTDGAGNRRIRLAYLVVFVAIGLVVAGLAWRRRCRPTNN